MKSDDLSARKIANALVGQAIGHEIYVFDEISSTSDHVKELGQAGYPEGVVVYAESQTAGRGRRANLWASDRATDILHSVLLRPKMPLEFWPRLTTIAALSVVIAVEKTFGLEPKIKWPNDVYLNNKKFVGILAETFLTGEPYLVLGMGINVNTSVFEGELERTATSLWMEKGRPDYPLERERLAIAILQELNFWTRHWVQGYAQVIQEVSRRSWLLGKRIRAIYQDREVFGIVLGLNPEGYLILEQENGQALVLSSAEQVRPEC